MFQDNIVMQHTKTGDFAYDDNFEFNINSVRTFSKLQNDTLFMETDQCNREL